MKNLLVCGKLPDVLPYTAKCVILFTLFVCLINCGSADNDVSRQNSLEKMENNILLPQGSRHIMDYDKFYLVDGDGIVNGRYIYKGRELIEVDFKSCKILMHSGSAIDPSYLCKAYGDMYASLVKRRYAIITDQKLRDYLPFILDGGCDEINFVYDIARHRFVENPRCNGSG